MRSYRICSYYRYDNIYDVFIVEILFRRVVANLFPIFSGIWLMIGADNRLTIKVLFFIVSFVFAD